MVLHTGAFFLGFRAEYSVNAHAQTEDKNPASVCPNRDQTLVLLKRELRRIHINGCRYNERLNVQKQGSKRTLGCAGRNNSKTSIRSHGHTGGTRPGQTCKTPKDLSSRVYGEREERGSGEGVRLYPVHIRK